MTSLPCRAKKCSTFRRLPLSRRETVLRKTCFCLLLISASIASAEVIETLQFQEYAVRAGGEKSLLVAINNASPIHRGGRTFHGYTTWHVRWNYRWTSDGNGRCKITTSKVDVSGTVLLPKLIAGTDGQRGSFERYITNLRTHELGHVDIGKRAANAIDSFLLSLPSRGDCSVLEREANEGAYSILEKHKQIEERYDVDTAHGKTQGAWLSNQP